MSLRDDNWRKRMFLIQIFFWKVLVNILLLDDNETRLIEVTVLFLKKKMFVTRNSMRWILKVASSNSKSEFESLKWSFLILSPTTKMKSIKSNFHSNLKFWKILNIEEAIAIWLHYVKETHLVHVEQVIVILRSYKCLDFFHLCQSFCWVVSRGILSMSYNEPDIKSLLETAHSFWQKIEYFSLDSLGVSS